MILFDFGHFDSMAVKILHWFFLQVATFSVNTRLFQIRGQAIFANHTFRSQTAGAGLAAKTFLEASLTFDRIIKEAMEGQRRWFRDVIEVFQLF